MIGLANCAPTPALLEKRNDMIRVFGSSLKIHEKRLSSVVCHDRGRKDSAFEAMSALFFDNSAGREICLSHIFKIDGEPVQVLLYRIWGAEIFEKLSFVGD